MKNYDGKGFLKPCSPNLNLSMKLTALFLLVSIFSVEASVYSQKNEVTLDLIGVETRKVLETIESLTDLKFFYNNKKIDAERIVSVKVVDRPVSEVLDILFEGTAIYYILRKRQVILKLGDIGKPSSKDSGDRSSIVDKEMVQQSVSGIVTDANGAPLPGANILEKGTTNGVQSDFDGNFSIEVSDGNAVLVFSYVGFATKEVPVNDKTILNVRLEETAEGLDEVVVTALGITKEKKALVYSVSEVEGNDLTQAREMNVANSLSGKVAGVTVSGMATGAGGSSRVIIRGNGSLNGNNMPLYVVNGMPIDNSIPGGPATRSGGRINVDRGDGIGGINPDDIETISVLKGGAAAALYGSRAANGVILITTKKGKAQENMRIKYNSTSTYDFIYLYPDFQYEYGQGVDGTKPMTQAEALNSGHTSFGARMDGKPYVQFDGVERPYSPVYVKDNLNAVYRMGTNFANTLAFTGGSEHINYRFSLSNTDAENIQPNSSFNRKVFNLNLNASLGKKLSIQAVGQYNIEKANNRPKIGYEDVNASWVTQVIANTVDITDLAPGYDEEGKEIQWGPWAESTNVYFTLNKFINHDKKNRFIGQVNIKYDLSDNLFIKGTIGEDHYNFGYVAISPWNLAFRPLGDYESINSLVTETNSMLILNYNTKFLKNFSLNALFGGNRQSNRYEETRIVGRDYVVPYFYEYTNLSILNTVPTDQRSQINSFFGSVDLDYKNMAFLTMTGREDWFSTLSPENNHIFYPSIGGSVILSEALDLPSLFSFVKLRGSWAQVGASTVDPYQINQTYGLVQGGHNGRPVQTLGKIPNPNLRPLVSTTYEIGFESRFINNRFGIDFTFYNRQTTDDIVETEVSSTSGMNSALLNIGKLSNKGIEMLLDAKLLEGDRFKWDISYNLAYNKSEILQLAPGLDTREIGKPYNTLWGYDKLVDENGESVYDANSGYAAKTELLDLGVGVPPYTMGFTSNLSYKDFSLNILLDGKFGNSIWSRTSQYTQRFGLQKRTLPGRENGLTVTGVDTNGNPFTKTWPVEDLDSYYDNDKHYDTPFIYDGSFVKLRRLILGYHIPVKNQGLLRSASVSLVASNLLTLYSKTGKLFDPESNNLVTNDQGYESFGVPPTRTVGINFMVEF